MNKIEKYLDKTIENVFADRFSRYSKYIIQERALPDSRDGLKPVQRRILYAMYKDKNTFERQFRKSAKTVGNVIGNYHPHGDSSVYEAMVRMSQSWKINEPLVLMHGNNGSIDGDNAAAMRYTEAKLSLYSNYMLSDIEQNVVNMIPNFDDTEFEPSVLPARVPNLLINGTSGIASGYATEIPPHNMKEVIKAAIYLNKNSEATLKDLMKLVKAPDFPTGGVIYGTEGIKKAYETGRGKLILRSQYEIKKNEIIITEIPYGVNKATLLQKIEFLKLEKKVEGINEITDQSGKDVEIVISCFKNIDPQLIMNYLLKNTELQKNYNFNMIAINNKKPELMGLKEMLLSFLKHREDVIIKRSNTLLEKNKKRVHILEGLILAITNLDKVVAIIRKSLDKQDAKINLINEFKFSEEQAEAIVMMQLYRLTNTDIAYLEKNYQQLQEEIKELMKILNQKEVLLQVIEDELKEILEQTKGQRRTKIEQEYKEITVNKEDLIKEERNIIVLSQNNYIKRSNIRSFVTAKSNPQLLEGDKYQKIMQLTNKDKLIFIFENGQYALVPVYDILENKWKDMGQSLGTLIKGGEENKVIDIIKYEENIDYLMTVTEKGYVIKIEIKDLLTTKMKQKIKYQGLKAEDKVVSATTVCKKENIIMMTNTEKYLIVNEEDFELFSIKRVGRKIKGINKKENLRSINVIDEEILLMSTNGYYFRINKEELLDNHFRFELMYENIKSNPQDLKLIITDPEQILNIIEKDKIQEIQLTKFNKSQKNEKIRNLTSLNKIELITNEIIIK